VRNQIAMNSEVANIYSATQGYQGVGEAATRNAEIAAAVPYGTIPSLFLTNSYDDPDGQGYYWGGAGEGN
jgi:hypothetical protein